MWSEISHKIVPLRNIVSELEVQILLISEAFVLATRVALKIDGNKPEDTSWRWKFITGESEQITKRSKLKSLMKNNLWSEKLLESSSRVDVLV